MLPLWIFFEPTSEAVQTLVSNPKYQSGSATRTPNLRQSTSSSCGVRKVDHFDTIAIRR